MDTETVYCTACDMVIKPGKDVKVTPGKKQKPKHVTGPVEIRAVRRYFLRGASKDVEDVLVHYKYQLPFCSVCMDMVGRICDFEDEIIHLKQLIDSMVSCLKMKIQVSLDNSMHRPVDEQTVRLRASMVGEPQWEEKYGHIIQAVTEMESPATKPGDARAETEQLNTDLARVEVGIEEIIGETSSEALTSHEQIKESGTTAEGEAVTGSLTNQEVPCEVVEEVTVEGGEEGAPEGLKGERRSGRITKPTSQKYSDFVSTEDIASDEDEELEDEDEYEDVDENYSDYDADEKYFDADEDVDVDELLGLPDIGSDGRMEKRTVTEVEGQKYRYGGVTFSMKEDKTYQCDECEKVLKTRGGALIHIRNVHLSGPRECKKRGRPRTKTPGDETPPYKKRKTGRKQRPVIVLGPDRFEFQGHPFSRREDGKFQCGSCPNILKTRDSILVHIKQRHLGEGLGTFLCHLCGKSFERDVYLKIHEINHLNPKSLHCETCGKAFTQYANLYNHKKIHLGQLNFHCEFENCGKKFLTRKQLTTHVRRHTGDRPYQCDLCPKRFVRASELSIHLRSHSDIRPFECHLCDSKFFIRGRLKRHLKNVHKLDTVGQTTIEAVPQEGIIIEVPTTAQVQVQSAGGGQQQFTVQQATAHFLTLNDIYTTVA